MQLIWEIADKTLYPLLSAGFSKEDRKSSWYDWKIVDLDVKNTYKKQAFQNSVDPDQLTSQKPSNSGSEPQPQFLIKKCT